MADFFMVDEYKNITCRFTGKKCVSFHSAYAVHTTNITPSLVAI